MAIDRLQQLQQLLTESPSDAFLVFAMAQEYKKRGEVDTALSYYQRLEKEHPYYVGTYYHLGKLYEQRGEVQQALNTYQQGMSIAQRANDQHAYSELAGAKLSLEEDTW